MGGHDSDEFGSVRCVICWSAWDGEIEPVYSCKSQGEREEGGGL